MHKEKEYLREVLDEGDIIELKEGNVYTTLPYHCLYSNGRGVFDKFAHDLVSLSKCEWLQGKYFVYKVTHDGGGRGGNAGEYYPNGHHVFCKKMFEERKEDVGGTVICSNINREGTCVDFYQTGSFTALIYDLKPIGKAELQYKELSE